MTLKFKFEYCLFVFCAIGALDAKGSGKKRLDFWCNKIHKMCSRAKRLLKLAITNSKSAESDQFCGMFYFNTYLLIKYVLFNLTSLNFLCEYFLKRHGNGELEISFL